MKVLHIITGLGMGGAEKHLLKVLPLMKKTEHIVCSLRNQKETGKKLAEQGIKIYYLSEGKGLFKSIRNFRRIIKYEKPDILCTYLINADLFGRVFGRLFGIKRVICNIRVVFNEGYFKEVGRLPLFLEKISSGLNTEYIANSETAKKSLVEKQGIKTSKIKVITNGIDLDNIKNTMNTKAGVANKRRVLGLAKDDLVISCIGRLHEQKGQIYLIRAMHMLIQKDKKNKRLKCLFIGEGEKRQEYTEEIKRSGLEDNITLLGNRDDTVEIIKASDMFVLPTNYEGMSNAILEAMACKVPIITTNIPENKELISDEREGLLVDTGSPEQIADRIILLVKNKQKTKAIIERAYEKSKRYDIKKTANQFEEAYLELG
jgi:glycosyltransferase involved in cell wall biosynthesis